MKRIIGVILIVACVIVPPYVTLHYLSWGKQCYKEESTFLGARKSLPGEVQEWAELLTCPEVNIGGKKVSLANLNDEGVSFIEIADLIDKTLVMNKVVKEKWVCTLRNGEYKQGKYCLRSGNKFCCLGVLCDIYAKEKGIEWEH